MSGEGEVRFVGRGFDMPGDGEWHSSTWVAHVWCRLGRHSNGEVCMSPEAPCVLQVASMEGSSEHWS